MQNLNLKMFTVLGRDVLHADSALPLFALGFCLFSLVELKQERKPSDWLVSVSDIYTVLALTSPIACC